MLGRLRKREKRNQCGFWDCDKRIPADTFLCQEHYQGWTDGIIDRCPKCTRFKDVMYRLCLDCYFGRKVPQWQPTVQIPTPKKKLKVDFSEAWQDGYLRKDRYFVYILEVDYGNLLIGHTADIRKLFSEHKDPKTSAQTTPPPKLQYLQIVATRDAAELREAELKKLVTSNPEQVRLMIADFRQNMKKFGVDQDT